jgi:drug/metabolite transporter (DMT)-like permease
LLETRLMAVLLAIAAAVGWGAADFFGGAFRRKTPVLVIVAITEFGGLVLLLPVLIAHGVPLPDNPRLLLAGVAGVGVTIELSRGDAFITASVGSIGAALAVTVGLVGGDPLSVAITVGLLCALIGGAVSAGSPAPKRIGRRGIRGVLTCAGAAAGMATMLSCFHAAGQIDPYWATAVEHASTALSAGLVALVGGRSRGHLRLPQLTQLPGLAVVAVAGVAGDLAYASASHGGALSIVSALASLYPLTTVMLAVVPQGQRIGRRQTAAIAFALVGAVILGGATG